MPDSWIDKEELDELVGAFTSPRKRRRGPARLPRARVAKKAAVADAETTGAPLDPSSTPAEMVISAPETPGPDSLPVHEPVVIAEPEVAPPAERVEIPMIRDDFGEPAEDKASEEGAAGNEGTLPAEFGEMPSPFELDEDDDDFEGELGGVSLEDDSLAEEVRFEEILLVDVAFDDEDLLTGEASVEFEAEEQSNAPLTKEEPTEEAPTEEAPVEEAPVEEAPVGEAPVGEAPVGEAPVEEEAVEEEAVEEEAVEEEAVEDEASPGPKLEEGVAAADPGSEPADSEEALLILSAASPAAEMIVEIEETQKWQREIPEFLDDSESFVMPLTAAERDADRALAALRAARARAEEGGLLRDWQAVPVKEPIEVELDAETGHEDADDLPVVEAEDDSPSVEEAPTAPELESLPEEVPVFRTLSEKIAHRADLAMAEVGALAVVICDEDGFLLHEKSDEESGESALSLETGLLIDAVKQADARLGLSGEGVAQVSAGGGQWRCLLRASDGSVRLHAGLLLERPLESGEIVLWRQVLAESCRLFSKNHF